MSARKPSSQSRTSSSSSSSSSDSDGNSPKSKTWFKRSSSPKVSFFASFRGSNTNTVSPVIPAMEEMQPLATDGEVLPRASPNLPWQLNLETVPHDSPLLFCNIFADVEHGQQQRRAMVFYTNVANALSRYVDIACTNFHTLMHDNGHRNVLELVAEALLMIPEDVFDLEDAAQSTSSAFVRPFVNALLNLAINWVGRQLEVDPHVVTLSVLSMGSMRSLIAHLSSIVLKYKEQVPRGIQLSIAHLMGLFIASNGFVPANPSALDSTDADADLPESAKNALLLILQNFSQVRKAPLLFIYSFCLELGGLLSPTLPAASLQVVQLAPAAPRELVPRAVDRPGSVRVQPGGRRSAHKQEGRARRGNESHHFPPSLTQLCAQYRPIFFIPTAYLFACCSHSPACARETPPRAHYVPVDARDVQQHRVQLPAGLGVA